MPASKSIAAVRYKKSAGGYTVELICPTGTQLAAVLKVQRTILRDVIKQINPGGCLPCLSGQDFRIREGLEHVLPANFVDGKVKNVIPVDLDTGKIRM